MRPPVGISRLPLTHCAKCPSGESGASAVCPSVGEASWTRTLIPCHMPPTILKVWMGISLPSICQPAEMNTSRQSSAYLYASSLFAMDMIENRPGCFFKHAANSLFVISDRRRGGCDSLAFSGAVWPRQGRTMSTSIKRTGPYLTADPSLVHNTPFLQRADRSRRVIRNHGTLLRITRESRNFKARSSEYTTGTGNCVCA